MQEILRLHDYRDILKEAVKKLREQNQRHSLRSIAIQLQVDPSFISLLLAKKRHVDVKKIGSVAEVFRIPESQRDFFYLTYLVNQQAPGSSDSTLTNILEAYRTCALRHPPAQGSAGLILSALTQEIGKAPVAAKPLTVD